LGIAEAALQHSSLGDEMEAAGLPAWSILAVAIAEARYGDGAQEWKDYAKALPSSTGCVLEWTNDEVYHFLPVLVLPLQYCNSLLVL
jgi:hypothetical protein